MNAVEIEAAVSELAAQPFEPREFPFAFLAAFGNKETTLTLLRKGGENGSDLPGGVLHDRFGEPVRPREWFIVPLPVIDDAVKRIVDGSITGMIYDPKSARLTEK